MRFVLIITLIVFLLSISIFAIPSFAQSIPSCPSGQYPYMTVSGQYVCGTPTIGSRVNIFGIYSTPTDITFRVFANAPYDCTRNVVVSEYHANDFLISSATLYDDDGVSPEAICKIVSQNQTDVIFTCDIRQLVDCDKDYGGGGFQGSRLVVLKLTGSDCRIAGCTDLDRTCEFRGSYYGCFLPRFCDTTAGQSCQYGCDRYRQICNPPPPIIKCGNNVCDSDENFLTCSQDCPLIPNCNNNQICDENENIQSCPSDCPILPPPPPPTNFCDTITGQSCQYDCDRTTQQCNPFPPSQTSSALDNFIQWVQDIFRGIANWFDSWL